MTRQSNLKFNYAAPQKRQNKEATLQAEIVQAIRILGHAGLVWGASMNGVHLGLRAAQRMKAQGMQAGEADLWFLIAGHYYGLEVKNGKEGVQSKEQKDFEARVNAAGGTYKITRTLDDALETLSAWRVIKPIARTRVVMARAA